MKAFYVAGTHWDREWYETYQEYRMWLVELIDELIGLLESTPDYPYFHLDGQTIVLEDYLEIRPENEGRLVKLLQEGRLVAGPWYNLPDEWLISGESFVRNIMKGLRICRKMNFPPMDFLYTPDQFGHIAALPMIAAGFGFKTGICWRGAQNENYPAQFVWVGPDGSRMVTHKLQDLGGYDIFRYSARQPMKDKAFSDESFAEHFEPLFAFEKERAHIPLTLLLDAVDHQRPDPEMPAFFQQLQVKYPEVEFVWGRLDEYGAEMLKHVDQLPERTGELRQPSRAADRVHQYLIVHTLSSRYPIKQRNGQCQALLERWAEPMALFQKMQGGEPILSYLDRAWTWLLKNHPHDSICGCSIDQVHRDMRFRFDQAELIGDGFTRRATAALCQASDKAEDWRHMAIQNPLPFKRREVVELTIPFPCDYAKENPQLSFMDGLATSERINKFHLIDTRGARVPYQHVRIERGISHKRVGSDGRFKVSEADCYTIAAEIEMPPCGHTTISVEETTEATRNFGSMRTGALEASNGLISVAVQVNGTVKLAHLPTRRSFEGLFIYEDSGDSGDGWTRGPLVSDIVYKTPGTSVTTAIEEDGPIRTVFRIERAFALPECMDKPHYRRSVHRESLRITDWLTIEAHQPYLHVKTVVHNTVRDHRLRVLFPTHADVEKSFADSPFAIVERDIAIPPESAHWQERINSEKPFTSFFGIQDRAGGFAVMSPAGLHEYSITQTPERILSLTLFRATQQTVFTNGEPDGQLQEPLTFEYALVPYKGQFDAPRAIQHVQAWQAGIRTHHVAAPGTSGPHLRLHPGVCPVSAIKPAADGEGGVVRFWNPTSKALTETLFPAVAPREAHACNLDEQPQHALPIGGDGGITVEIPARGLATVRFTW
jgi:alpha-mannosidase/mannosylglycerate hydrolase